MLMSLVSFLLRWDCGRFSFFFFIRQRTNLSNHGLIHGSLDHDGNTNTNRLKEPFSTMKKRFLGLNVQGTLGGNAVYETLEASGSDSLEPVAFVLSIKV